MAILEGSQLVKKFLTVNNTIQSTTIPTQVTGLSVICVVTDEVEGRTMATWDGTNWRRVSDGAVCT